MTMNRARNSRGRVLAVLATVAVWSVSTTAVATTAETTARWVTADPCLKLRQEPDESAPVVRCLPPGVEVAVTESAPGWENVELSDGTRGWMAAQYLSREPLPAGSPTAVGRRVSSSSSPGPQSSPSPKAPHEIEQPSAMTDIEFPAASQVFVTLDPFEPIPADTTPVARRGVFRRRELLTGELVPTRATPIVVPRTRAWNVQIRWLAEDGAEVELGEVLVEFDKSSLASRLEDLRISAVESADTLSRTRVEGEASGAERVLELERTRIELEKARLAATVPEDLLSRREFQDRQLALRRAEIAFVKARDNLDTHQTTNRANVDIKQIALDKSIRQIDQLERDIEALSPKAPERGFALIESHPWERRKFAVGDTLWPGMTVLTLPDLASLQVEAKLIDVDDGKIGIGMPAICRLDAYPATTYACRVSEITPVAQADSIESLRRVFKVRIDLERTDLATMRPGMSVSIEIESQRFEDVLLAPRAALDLAAAPVRAFLAGGSTAEIELGPCNALECVVRDGIAEGQELRSAGSQGL